MSNKPLGPDALDTLFRSARRHSYWLDKPVTDEQLHKLYELMKWGPTSGNCTPARLVFVRNPQAKERLMPYHDAGNVNKFMTAPVVAIMDIERLDAEFFPDVKVKSNFICAIGWRCVPASSTRTTA